MTLRTGTVFAGRYRVVRPIGAGGMGEVYEVVEVATSRRRALKIMLAHLSGCVGSRERFRREALVSGYVASEFITAVLDAGVDEATGLPFFLMELLEGADLGRVLLGRGRIAAADVVGWLGQAALGIDAAHRAGIFHRDLKPENLFLATRPGGAPRIQVLDFGIARIVAEGTINDSLNQALGTPLYMSPEQLDLGKRPTGAVDVYALGLIAYTLLVGKEYWAEEALRPNLVALVRAMMIGPDSPASARAARAGVELPAAFDAWFAAATAFDPARRFPTAVEAIDALADALESAPRGAPIEDAAKDAPPASGVRATPELGSKPKTVRLPSSG